MNGAAEDPSRIAAIVRTLCAAKGREVVFRFNGLISVPIEKYDGWSYRTDTLPKATLNATIHRAEVEHLEGVLMCFAEIKKSELDRVGIDASVVYTEPIDGSPKRCVVEVCASRKWVDEAGEISREEAERAVEEGQEEAVLPPWDGLPTVVVEVERTQECLERSYNSNFDIQYDPPSHEMGDLIDVRIKRQKHRLA